MNRKLLELTSIILTGALLLSSCSFKKRYKGYYDIPANAPSSYCVFDDSIPRSVDNQVRGTCWASAATTAMEYSYYKTVKHYVQFDSSSLAFMVYNPHTTEGYYVDERGGAYDIGGNGYYVVGVTSNGFGDYTLVDSCDLSVSSQEDIKRAIMAFGGVTAGISDNSNNYTWANDTYTMIAGPGDPFEHSVVLVGWDDSFPATAFSTTASTDGAWYVQNSYSRSWGDDGYYWVSYDTPLDDIHSYVLSNRYSYVASYESGHSGNLSSGNSTTVANVFERPGRLSAVGTYTTCPNQRLTISIYDKNMERVIDSYSAEFEFIGYHVITLDEPILVDGVAVAITYSGTGAPVEGSEWHTGGAGYNASIREGQSYIRRGNEWLDLADPQTTAIIGLDEPCNNVCIKALYT